MREDVDFYSHQTRCSAWLYQPDGDGQFPIVIMAHGFGMTREARLDTYAKRLLKAGLGVFLFDYRHFGASDGEPRQLLSIRRQLQDWRAAIKHVQDIKWVNQHKIALFGTSYSGGHVVEVAAENERIAAVVAQCPFSDGIATTLSTSPRTVLRLAAHGVRDQLGALARRPPHYVPAAAEPGALGVMNTEDSLSGAQALVPKRTTWVNQVAARIALQIPFYRPGPKAAKIQCPALWCITDNDTLCPAENTAKWAARAPQGEVKRYPIGHFDIYVGTNFEKAIADQIEFLQRHLLPKAS